MALLTPVAGILPMCTEQDAHKDLPQASAINVMFHELADINVGTNKVRIKMASHAKRCKASKATRPPDANTKVQSLVLASVTKGHPSVQQDWTTPVIAILPMPTPVGPLGTLDTPEGNNPSVHQGDSEQEALSSQPAA
jgi:hypothetical protein